jgi:hypothetical protein
MNAGSIQVTSTEGNIDFGQNNILANSEQGSGGNITLTGRDISTSGIITYANGNAGNIKN